MKVLTSALVVFLLSGVIMLAQAFSPYAGNDNQGEIIIEVVDAGGDLVISDTISFNETDTLFALMDRHYKLTWRDYHGSVSGRVILGIDAVETDFESSFIKIYIDGHLISREGAVIVMDNQPSLTGVDAIPLIDGNRYRFVYTTLNGGGN